MAESTAVMSSSDQQRKIRESFESPEEEWRTARLTTHGSPKYQVNLKAVTRRHTSRNDAHASPRAPSSLAEDNGSHVCKDSKVHNVYKVGVIHGVASGRRVLDHRFSGLAHFRFSIRPVLGHRISCQDTGSIVAPVHQRFEIFQR